MDPVTQRLVDAALKLPETMGGLEFYFAYDKLVSAAAAYLHANRPLMERLADLKPDSMVELLGGSCLKVAANLPEHESLWLLTGCADDPVRTYCYRQVVAIPYEAP